MTIKEHSSDLCIKTLKFIPQQMSFPFLFLNIFIFTLFSLWYRKAIIKLGYNDAIP